MRIHPPDLAHPVPSSGRWGIFFLVMCCFLASEILYSLLVEGAVVGKCLLSKTTSLILNVFLLFFLFSSWIFFCFSALLFCSPSYSLPELTFAVRQPYYFVLQTSDYKSFVSSLFFSIMVPLPFFDSLVSLSIPQTSPFSNVSLLTPYLLVFCSFA